MSKETQLTPLFLGSDHGGFELKNAILDYLKKTRPLFQLSDLGTYSTESVDYPDFAKKVCEAVLGTPKSLGILVCGTGVGISMAANRFKGIRAALVYSLFTAQMAKKHNDANILCLGGRTTSLEDAKLFVDTWLDESFEGGRHLGRIQKMDC